VTESNTDTSVGSNGRPARVLVIDDDADVRGALQGVLEDEGLLVDVASDGAQALIRAARHRPTLVVLDIKLPDSAGHEVARRLRVLHGARLPILAITADGSAARKAREVGAFAYLTKPFELARLLELVQNQIAST
jgi:DNA-binding response OmpR family regulator